MEREILFALHDMEEKQFLTMDEALELYGVQLNK